jgi:hypothetical protein
MHLERGRGIAILERTMKRATEYAGRLRRARAVGILLNDGRVVSYPLRPTSLAGDLKRLLTRLAG